MEESGRSDIGRRGMESGGRHSCAPEHALELVRRAQAGDARAAQELHEIFTPMLLGAIAPYRRDPLLGEEVPGEAYLILHRLLLYFDFQRGVNLFTYLERALPKALRRCVRRQRTISRREVLATCLAPESDEGHQLAGETGDSLERMIDAERRWAARDNAGEEAMAVRMTLAAAVNDLPERQREVVILWKAGYSFEEMATELDASTEACRQAFQRARGKLREALSGLSGRTGVFSRPSGTARMPFPVPRDESLG